MTTFKLNNGQDMPKIGLGTYTSTHGEVEQAVKDAIDVGYRHIDTAWFYGNEAEIGKAVNEKIKDGTIKREDIFITTKLWCNHHAKEKVVQMLKKSLSSMHLDFVDLYLVHWPMAFKENASPWPIDEGSAAYSDIDYLETWEGMEECVTLGLTKSIGVSNFNSEQIDRLYQTANIKPVCNQVEVHVNFPQKNLIEFCKQRNIIVTAYCPLGKANAADNSLAVFDTKVAEIGKKYGKTPAQVVLNYLVKVLQVCVIPKSVKKHRIIENFNILDFDLSKDEVIYMDSLNNKKRIVAASMFSDHKYYPFNLDF